MAAFVPNNLPSPTVDTTPLHTSKHLTYLTTLSEKLSSPTSYEGALTEHLRMSGVYWTVAAVSLIQTEAEVDEKMNKKVRLCCWCLGFCICGGVWYLLFLSCGRWWVGGWDGMGWDGMGWGAWPSSVARIDP